MKSILFVCHGNICRSVMAQYIFQDLVHMRHLDDEFFVDSAAVSSEETGSTIYPPARAKLIEKGVPVGSHRARTITPADYDRFDEIYIMDRSNAALLRRILPHDPQRKIHPLIEDRSVADPWYTGDFETAYQDILEGCRQRLDQIISKGEYKS